MKLDSPLLMKLLAGGFAALTWLIFRTLRLRIETAPGANPYEPGNTDRYLYSVWHDSMVIACFGGSHPCTTALTSQHTDGSFVAQVLRWKGIPAVRGSTSRISTGSIRRLMEDSQTRHIVITPDGPRGPDRQMSAGIAFISSRSGRGIVPVAASCASRWLIKGSWSDLVIPKPFSRVVMLAGDPIFVDPELTNAQIKDEVKMIQAAMDELQAEADRLLAA